MKIMRNLTSIVYIYSLRRWQDALVVTEPSVLAAIMGRGEGAMDKAALVYSPINKMCDPHRNANLLTSAADDTWKAIRKAVAVSFSMQVRQVAIRHRRSLAGGFVADTVAMMPGPDAPGCVPHTAALVTKALLFYGGSSSSQCPP